MPRSKPDDPFGDNDPFFTGDEGSAREDSDEMPESTVDPSRSDWLKPFHLSARQGTLELISVSGSTEFSDVTLHVKVGTRPFRIGLKTFDPAYVALKKKFGAKKSDWHGTLLYKVMPHKGRADGFVAVRPK